MTSYSTWTMRMEPGTHKLINNIGAAMKENGIRAKGLKIENGTDFLRHETEWINEFKNKHEKINALITVLSDRGYRDRADELLSKESIEALAKQIIDWNTEE